MSGPPTFSVRPTFLGIERTNGDAPICVVGIPLDIGTTNRAGARFGPQAIRHASRMLVDGLHPVLWVDPLQLPISDIGNFEIALGDLAKSLDLIENQARLHSHLITLGGDHGITLPLLRALAKHYGPVGLIHFDAHVDTWPETFGQPNGHGSVFFQAIEQQLVDPHRMVQIGIRSPVQREVFDWTTGKGVTIISAEDVHMATPDQVAEKIRHVVRTGPVYLSFDIDALDPAFAPGTGTPEIGGLASWQAQAILRRLRGLTFVGMDVVEVAPAYDVAEITALAGATVAWEYICMVAPLSSR